MDLRSRKLVSVWFADNLLLIWFGGRREEEEEKKKEKEKKKKNKKHPASAHIAPLHGKKDCCIGWGKLWLKAIETIHKDLWEGCTFIREKTGKALHLWQSDPSPHKKDLQLKCLIGSWMKEKDFLKKYFIFDI